MISTEQLDKKIDSFPRVHLAFLPTPLHELKRFSAALGGPRIFIKRDDCTGLAFGGNKTRMFEFLLAKAQQEGADAVIGGAGVQSNYCRQLTAACNVLGMETHLVLRRVRGAKDNAIQGNLLLDLLAGAHVHIIDADADRQRERMYALAGELERSGKHPFVARMAAADDLSLDTIAYVECFREVWEQCAVLGIEASHLYVSSYDTTQAGLEVGNAALGAPLQVRGIAPATWDSDSAELICHYANQAARALDIPCTLNAEGIFNTTAYAGEGYGIPTPESLEMLSLMARTEGIYLDPVYTSKAMAGIRDHIKTGQLKAADTVVFLHTGGTPALFAYADTFDTEKLRANLDFNAW